MSANITAGLFPSHFQKYLAFRGDLDGSQSLQVGGVQVCSFSTQCVSLWRGHRGKESKSQDSSLFFGCGDIMSCQSETESLKTTNGASREQHGTSGLSSSSNDRAAQEKHSGAGCITPGTLY